MTVKQLSASVLPAFPLLLLLLALSTVFLFGNDRGYFYRYKSHSTLTGNHMAVAANLSPAHNFLGFYRQTLDTDGTPTYEVYNRFPIGGYLLIKLAILPFWDDPSAQLYAARLLMLLFFTATAVLAYLSLSRLTAQRWIALTATLLTFSSSYCLYYNDMVATDGCPGLFGVWLVFHGMVLFVQEGRFRQLLVKTCLGLLLVWHVYALLLPFVVSGLASVLVKARSGGERGINSLWQLTHVTTSLLRSRYLVLGVVALLFGTAVLSFNFANEYFALNGATGVTDLPSVRSMLKRTGQDEAFTAQKARFLAWPSVLKSQFYRIGGMSLPFSLTEHDIRDLRDPSPEAPLGLQHALGIVVSGTCLIGLVFVRHKILWATLVLSGFCWGLPMRHDAALPHHNFEGLLYIGPPLLFFSLVLQSIHRLSGRRLRVAVGLSVAALLVFVLSSFQMARVGYTAEAAEFQKNRMTDFDVIRKMTVGKVAAIPENVAHNMRYALTGTILLFPDQKSRFADFVISRRRHHDAAVLTPDNRRVFLYPRSSYESTIDAIIKEVGEPLIHAEYRERVIDVYRSDNRLYYVRSPTSDTQPPKSRREATFFLHVIPVDVNDLPDDRKQYGFNNMDFHFSNCRIPHGKRAIAVRELPPYDVARIRTGQFIRAGSQWKHLWKAEVSFEESRTRTDRGSLHVVGIGGGSAVRRQPTISTGTAAAGPKASTMQAIQDVDRRNNNA